MSLFLLVNLLGWMGQGEFGVLVFQTLRLSQTCWDGVFGPGLGLYHYANLLQSFSELTVPEPTSPVIFQVIWSQLSNMFSSNIIYIKSTDLR